MSKRGEKKGDDGQFIVTEHKRDGKIIIVLRAGPKNTYQRPGSFIRTKSAKPKERKEARKQFDLIARDSDIRSGLLQRLSDSGIDISNVRPAKKFIRISDSKTRLNRAGRVGGQFEVIYIDDKGRERSSIVRGYSARTRKSMRSLNKEDIRLLLEQAARAAAKRVMLDAAVASDGILSVDIVDGPFFAYDIDKRSGYAEKGDIDAIEGFKPSQRKRFAARRKQRILKKTGFAKSRFDAEELKKEKEIRRRRARKFSGFPQSRW